MSDEFQKYEEDCDRIRRENARLLEEFESWLAAKGLSAKTIKAHVENVSFFINHCLLYDEAVEAAEGVSHINYFLGYWFIRKAIWSSPASIRGNAASIRKFYAFMLAKGLIDGGANEEVRQTIKEGMPEWLSTMERYDDPSITDPEEIWGL